MLYTVKKKRFDIWLETEDVQCRECAVCLSQLPPTVAANPPHFLQGDEQK